MSLITINLIIDFFHMRQLEALKGLKVTNLNSLRQLFLAWEVLTISNECQKLSN